MKRAWTRALQGVLLSALSPLGWLALQWLDGANVVLQLLWHPGVYVYMLVGTALAFGGFGWYVGGQEAQYRENALHDALTGLYNSRYFWRRFGDEQAFASRHRRPLSLLIGDIDFFKRVNDTHGHAAGNQVLVAIAQAFMGARRRGDTIARIGGEEFAVILPETDLAEAVRVAERLRQAVAALRFDFAQAGRGREPFGVTLSFGAVEAPPGAAGGPGDLFQRADRALYLAKQAGRNRVVADGAEPLALIPAAPAPARPA